MKKKYIVIPGATGCVHVAPPPFPREKKGKFDMTEDLNQQELQYLYEDCNQRVQIIAIDVEAKPKKKDKEDEEKEKK